jgi:rhamnogalacturonyl hydrolase YesR
MQIDSHSGPSAEARRTQLIRSALCYAWWLGAGSAPTRKLISLTGWNLSRKLSNRLGRPSGALAWPLGVALLSANAGRAALAQDMPWLERCFSSLIDKSGLPSFPSDHLDRGGIGYAALRLHEATGNVRYRIFAETLAQRLRTLSRTPEGWFPYAPGRQEVLVDTLAFVCPFFARMARLGGSPDLRDLALHQMEAMWTHGRPDGGWVFHGFDALSRRPLGMQGWGRGVAWLVVAIVDTLHELPPGSARTLWTERCLELFGQLREVQKGDGHWPWNLGDPASLSDSSVTSLVAYALVRWRQLEPAEACPAQARMLEGACRALYAATLPDGRVGQASGEAGGAGSYSASFGHYLWSQAAAVAVDRILISGMEITSP